MPICEGGESARGWDPSPQQDDAVVGGKRDPSLPSDGPGFAAVVEDEETGAGHAQTALPQE